MIQARWAAALAALIMCAIALPANASSKHRAPRTGLAAHDNVLVYVSPSTHAHVLARLVQQTQVKVLAKHHGWDRVSMWAGIRGWARARDIVFHPPKASVSTYHAPEVHTPIRAHAATAVHASARVVPGGTAGRYGAGAVIHVSAWKQDAAGHVWYRVQGAWVRGDSVEFDPAHGQRDAWRVGSGKGMWLTLGTMTDNDPAALADAAVRAGITHMYLESAISPLGFHGRGSVGPVIEAAHARHLKVLAWVYPYLTDVGADIDLTRAVAAYRTANGQRFDGIAADLERNLTTANVRSYSQLIRASLPGEPLIGVTYPPQSLPDFPFGEIARQYDAIAPMDYWHNTKTSYGTLYGHLSYGSAYAYRYARDSVTLIRASGGNIPIFPIGQAFDNFGRLEMGPYAPSASETRGFLSGSRSAGARGVSFFQWMTVSQPEWHEVAAFRL